MKGNTTPKLLHIEIAIGDTGGLGGECNANIRRTAYQRWW